MAKQLEGRVALVTGASSGIGAATATALVDGGARVAVAARRAGRLAELVERIRHAGGEAIAVDADVADRAAAERMVAATVERFGRLDILVNNAGLMKLAPFAAGSPDDWRAMIDVNLLGVLYCTHAALPHLKRAGGGHVVNISSVAGREPFPTGAVYCATKYGVIGFSETLRREHLADKLRVTVIEPGAVATELVDQVTDEKAKQQIQAWQAAMRQLQPADIAAAIVYAVTQPDRVAVNELLVRPTDQAL
ncbi:MAG TPA: SDR family NAD(P)-dependent oxidoreductase [Polyangia bacterium]|jgi:NADP-dependent 3-hydroxy acid dehydrogenase YdfG